MTDLFADAPVPIGVQIAAAQREIEMRQRVYPSWVSKGRMTQSRADAEVAAMQAVLATLRQAAAGPAPFQARVQPWMLACFGEAISEDVTERNHRFLEEALELVQAGGCTASEAHQLVDYVFGRPAGDPHQEAGGVMVTLAALCLARRLDMHAAGEDELARIWTKVDQIRAKQAAKPRHSPLPGPSAVRADDPPAPDHGAAA